MLILKRQIHHAQPAPRMLPHNYKRHPPFHPTYACTHDVRRDHRPHAPAIDRPNMPPPPRLACAAEQVKTGAPATVGGVKCIVCVTSNPASGSRCGPRVRLDHCGLAHLGDFARQLFFQAHDAGVGVGKSTVRSSSIVCSSPPAPGSAARPHFGHTSGEAEAAAGSHSWPIEHVNRVNMRRHRESKNRASMSGILTPSSLSRKGEIYLGSRLLYFTPVYFFTSSANSPGSTFSISSEPFTLRQIPFLSMMNSVGIQSTP